MNSPSIPTSTASVKNEVYDTYTVPTFGKKQRDQEVELSVETLNDPAAANALRVADPFHSVQYSVRQAGRPCARLQAE